MNSDGSDATFYAPAPRLEENLAGFWKWEEPLEAADLIVDAAARVEGGVLKELGPSPFERGGFPLVGFLATVYEKIGRYARERLAGGRGRMPG